MRYNEEKIRELIKNGQGLEKIESDMQKAYLILYNAFLKGKKLLVCGNGGSSADADHIVGELVKGFKKKRKLEFEDRLEEKNVYSDKWYERLQDGMPVINLNAHNSLVSAIINDIGADLMYAQQVISYGKEGDVFLGISTSGNSENIIKAGIIAKERGIHTIGLVGHNGGMMKNIFDTIINVELKETDRIQEQHIRIYHTLCSMIEDSFWKE